VLNFAVKGIEKQYLGISFSCLHTTFQHSSFKIVGAIKEEMKLSRSPVFYAGRNAKPS